MCPIFVSPNSFDHNYPAVWRGFEDKCEVVSERSIKATAMVDTPVKLATK